MRILLILVTYFACLYFCQTADPQRPVFHFLPEKNWMNDPNGLMYFNSVYHIFYQWNPNAAINQNQYNVWGHAVSKDLVHWQDLPPAISPTPNSYDSNGCWTGSATIVNGVPTIIYTGISSQGSQTGESQNTATPTDINDPLLVNWTKTASNPVIPQPPPDLALSGFRDPTTAWHVGNNSSWYLEVGCGNSTGGMTLLYQSEDFVNWEYVHPLYFAPAMFAGDMYECPDFYNISDKVYVYKGSAEGWVGFDFWLTGSFDSANLVFVPFDNKEGWFDYGKFYASKSFYDPVGERQIVFGWSAEDDSTTSQVARGWAGVQTLPRQITLNNDDLTLSNYPISELQALRGQAYTYANLVVTNQELSLNITQGSQLEIDVQIHAVNGPPSRFGLKIRASPDRREYTTIYFEPATPYLMNQDLPGNDFKGVVIDAQDPGLCDELCNANDQCFSWSYAPPGDQGPSPMCFLKHFVPTMVPKQGTVSGIKGMVYVDRTNSSLATDTNTALQMAPLSAVPQSLTVFIDHSVVELYVNGGRANIVSRIYPILATSEGVSVFVEGGSASLDINIWEMYSIW